MTNCSSDRSFGSLHVEDQHLSQIQHKRERLSESAPTRKYEHETPSSDHDDQMDLAHDDRDGGADEDPGENVTDVPGGQVKRVRFSGDSAVQELRARVENILAIRESEELAEEAVRLGRMVSSDAPLY